MREIKAIVRQQRIAAVLQALREFSAVDPDVESCCRSITVMPVLRPLTHPEPIQQHYSMDLAEPVVNAYRVELFCTDDLVDTITNAIRHAAHTGQPEAGWIAVTEVQLAEAIS